MSAQTLSEAQIKIQVHSFNSLPQFRHNAHELGFQETDPVLRTRWKVLALCTASKDEYDPNIYGKQDRFWHECFKQIDKDVRRTFPSIDLFNNQPAILRFAKTLKNLAIYFPKIGYTQGINFLVGFLLTCRYQGEEVFWILVHLALNQRFLILGLYDDNFPLAEIYYEIFSHIVLEKFGGRLHSKLIEIPKEMWVLQWFMTFYLYNFPVDFAKHVWDLVFTTSGLGLVFFAVGIVNELRSHFQNMSDDDLEYVELFQRFKDRHWVQKNLDINRIMSFALALNFQFTNTKIASIVSTSAQKHIYTQIFVSYDDPYHVRSLMERYAQQLDRVRKEHFKLGSATSDKSLSSSSSQFRKMTNPVWFSMKIKRSLKTPSNSQAEKSWLSQETRHKPTPRLGKSLEISNISRASLVFVDKIKYSLIQGRQIKEQDQSFEGEVDDRIGCNEYFKAVSKLRQSIIIPPSKS